jgi:hypothetical protein
MRSRADHVQSNRYAASSMLVLAQQTRKWLDGAWQNWKIDRKFFADLRNVELRGPGT